MKALAFALALAALGLAAAAEESNPAPIRVLLLSGANNHAWKATTPVLRTMYEESGRFAVEVTDDVAALKPDAFAKVDVVVSNYTTYPAIEGKRWPAETEKAFLDYVKSGRGFALFHAASTAWNDWPEFTGLIGLSWQKGTSGHGAPHVFKVVVRDRDHPVTAGMRDFMTEKDELYHRQVEHPAMKVLCTAFSDPSTRGSGKDEPVALVTEPGRGRVFHNTLGHDPKPMQGTGWRTLMLRGTEWAATGKVTLPIPADWPEAK